MARYFAEISSNRVSRVIVVADANDAAWCAGRYGGTWQETKLDGSIYGTYAGRGYRMDTLSNTYVAQSHVFTVPSPVSACFLGDSVVSQMAGAPNLAAPLNSASNLGVSGNTVAQIAARVGSIGSANTVFLEGGTNDAFGLSSWAGVVPGYKSILQSISQLKRVVIVGVPQVDEAQLVASWGATATNVLNNANIASYNAQLAAYCSGWINCVIATQAMSMNMTGKTNDGIHLKSSAYAEWTTRIAAALT
jgi:lysophospholipase L1-like esterase